MSALLDLDDVVAGHPAATTELFDLRKKLAKLEISEEEMTQEFWKAHGEYPNDSVAAHIVYQGFCAGIKLMQERCK